MKVTIGGSKKMTIGNRPYEPVQVESIFIIEKEFPDELSPEEIAEGLQDRINDQLDKDLKNKLTKILKDQQGARDNMKKILEGTF